MSIADFYISNGLDPYNSQDCMDFFEWNRPVLFPSDRPKRRRYSTQALHEDELDRLSEGWKKLVPDEQHLANTVQALDPTVRYQKDAFRLVFFCVTGYVESYEGETKLFDKKILMKHVPAVFCDPTTESFDQGAPRSNVVGTVCKWTPRGFGFIKASDTGIQYFCHKSKLQNDISVYKLLLQPNVEVMFDTKPAANDHDDSKLDEAVNVRFYDSAAAAAAKDDPPAPQDDDSKLPLNEAKNETAASLQDAPQEEGDDDDSASPRKKLKSDDIPRTVTVAQSET